MGLLDDILHTVIAEVAEEHPNLTEEQCGELVEKMIIESLPKPADMLWPSIEALKEENLFHNRLTAEMFTKRNIFRWREGLDLMEMLGMISLEIGQMVNGDAEPNGRPMPGCKFRALVRLHAKALQIFWEITCLLKHGFADGALGRWRTLHEVAVVAFLLAAHDEDLAERFLAFRHVELWKSTEVYQEKTDTLGLEPLSDRDVEEARLRYKEVIGRYGESFDGDYGWAASVVESRGKYVTFRDIERATGIDHLKPYYKWSCQKIHVGCNTLHDSLGLSEAYGETIMMAGPSNAGHCDPAHLAAISLDVATCTLMSVAPSVDVLVGCKIIGILVEKIGDAFLRAHKQLQQEEDEIQHQADQSGEESGG
jgi:hypothetical protein